MKISININENLDDTEISISCRKITPEIESLLASLRMLDSQITVVRDGETFIVDTADIYYIESVDRKTFVYMKDEVYESGLKLYEMEERLCSGGFFRAGKSCLIQLRYIRSLKADIDRKIRVTLENGERLMVSRQYADELKRRLGI